MPEAAVAPTTQAAEPELALTKDGLGPPFDGERVVLNDGKAYVVPPLTFELIRMVRPVLEKIKNVTNMLTDPDATEMILSVCWCAVQLNYPDLTITRSVRRSLEDDTLEEKTFKGRDALRVLADF